MDNYGEAMGTAIYYDAVVSYTWRGDWLEQKYGCYNAWKNGRQRTGYHEGGRAREYYPLVRKEDVALSETKSLIDRVFKGSVNMMMSALVRSDELSKDEISELQAILKKAGEKAD
jgi:hypothetical protein